MPRPCVPQSRTVRWIGAIALFCAATMILPRWWCGRPAGQWYSGESKLSGALAREVAQTVSTDLTEGSFTSDVPLFRHEWVFGTYQMGALGLLQTCLEHPEMRAALLPAAERAIDKLLSAEVRAFDADSWDEDPLTSLAGNKGHAAYLGYTNLVLCLHRRVVPSSRFAALNDAISEALARRLRASRHGILETYPLEAYPIDNAAVLGSLLLHNGFVGGAHSDVTSQMLQRFRNQWRDPGSGLLCQAIDASSGLPEDLPRASGTALAAYFIGLADADFAAALIASLRQSCEGDVLGFGFCREYAWGTRGQGNIDSGPLIFGISPSATGFALAGARIAEEKDLYFRLYRTAHLSGAPVMLGGRMRFATGGPLGNSILLAMLTAPKKGVR